MTTGDTVETPVGGPRVVALDYDGTLTDADRPRDVVLAAIDSTRQTGIKVVLVTGRILAELESVFPDARAHFDAIVAENGAVLAHASGSHRIVRPIDPELLRRLHDRGIEARQGQVIVACRLADEHGVVDERTHLGIECQLVRNRAELMVVPSGVNKGTGLVHALDTLGYSVHDTIAVGDAENDHSLLDVAELGVAVTNAVPSLRASADLVLSHADGDGVVDLLAALDSEHSPWTERSSSRRLFLGVDADGGAVELPARPSNVLIAGRSGDGKSYLAGLLAEQLIELGYSLLVLDPEGDHCGLSKLPGTVVIGSGRHPPDAELVASLLDQGGVSVIVDLSGLDPASRDRYLVELPAEIEACRRTKGRPHWVFIDEAHGSVSAQTALGPYEPAAKGYCLVTWRPSELLPAALASLDVVLALTSSSPEPALVDLAAAVSSQPRSLVARTMIGPAGHVVVARRADVGSLRVVEDIAPRATSHFRHVHKYSSHGLPEHRRFVFHSDADHLTGATSANLAQFEAELARCQRSVLRHHLPRNDFSRWIAGVFHDHLLANAVQAIEHSVDATTPNAVVDAARLALLSVLRMRQQN
jgi:hydroxymethylpyrimidine pyrophosphatase-like HAD family hydrolase